MMKVLRRLCKPSMIFFNPKILDLIVIDPLRNIFDAGDHGTENDNNAMLFFLQKRLERLRHQEIPMPG